MNRVLIKIRQNIPLLILTLVIGAFAAVAFTPSMSYAAPDPGGGSDPTGHQCGARPNSIYTSINIGCYGKGQPIADMLFALLRFLTNGVGLVVIASIIVGGIQYTMSRGDPQATARAIDRIRNSFFALLLFLFAYAFLNFIIPAGFFQ